MLAKQTVRKNGIRIVLFGSINRMHAKIELLLCRFRLQLLGQIVSQITLNGFVNGINNRRHSQCHNEFVDIIHRTNGQHQLN